MPKDRAGASAPDDRAGLPRRMPSARLLVAAARRSMASWTSGQPRSLRYREALGRGEQRVLAYGDSLTAGYCDDGYAFSPYAPALEGALELVRVDHVGHSGMTAREMVAHAGAPEAGLGAILDAAAAAGSPYALVVVLAGTNDMPNVPERRVREDRAGAAAAVADAVWSVHSIAHARTVPTVAVGIPGSMAQARIGYFRSLADGANEALERRCQATSLATFLPCPVAFDERSGDWERDGLHMSRAGYERLGTGLAGVVRDALARMAPKDDGR